jgi:hypothetical protein
MAQVTFSSDTTPSLVDLDANFTELYSKTAYATTGIGYATGAGGTVTQLTSKSTGVTLNKLTGTVVTHNASLAAGATVAFVLTNSAWAGSGDVMLCQVINASVGSASTYNVWSWGGSGSGAVGIAIKNETAGALAEVLTIAFVIIRGVTS